MGLEKVKIYTATCDECDIEETYCATLKRQVPDGWEWKSVRGYFYTNEKLFCDKCRNKPRSKWDL